MKIRTKLRILPISLAIIMITASLLITIIISNNTIRKQVGNHLLTTAQSRAHNIKTLLNDYKETVKVLAVGIPFTNVFDLQIDYTKRMNECNLRIERTIESNSDIYRIRILNKNGIVISSSNKDIDSNLSESTLFKKGKENVYIADIHKSEYTGSLVISISAPIFLRDTFSGVLIINFDVEKKLFEILTSSTGLGKTGEIYLVNKDGYLLSPSRLIDVTILKTKINTEQIKLFLSEHIVKGFPENIEQKPAVYLDYRGKKVLGIHFYIPEMQWCLVAEFDIEEAYKPANMQKVLLIIIFSALLIVTIIVIIIISRDITLPIIKFHKGTEEIIKGNLDYKISIESKDEVGQLSRSFDIMTDKLRKAQNKLKTYSEDLETTVKERTAELEKQFTKSEKQRIATLVVLNDLNKTTKDLKTEIIQHKQAEEQIKRDLEEKNALIKEIYHRTKNNMQIISSMLTMKLRLSNDEFIHNTFKEINSKIKAMSLVHQKLYQSHDLSQINLKEYIESLSNQIKRNYAIKSKFISLKFDLQDVFILLDSAIPCGLVLNELISNAFKHAFPNNRKGEISIRLYKEINGRINIHLADNGIGVPIDLDIRKNNTMGLHFVFIIIEYQLHGEVTFDGSNGLKWHIKFSDDLHTKRI